MTNKQDLTNWWANHTTLLRILAIPYGVFVMPTHIVYLSVASNWDYTRIAYAELWDVIRYGIQDDN